MAKKVSKSNRDASTKRRSSVSSVSPRSYGDMFKDQPGGNTIPTPSSGKKSKASALASAAVKGSDTVNWEGDYAYVLKDLRWLLILSGVLLAAIVAAGFIL